MFVYASVHTVLLLREKFLLTHVANNKSLLMLHQTVLHELFVIIFLKVFKMDINPRLIKSSKQYIYMWCGVRSDEYEYYATRTVYVYVV